MPSPGGERRAGKGSSGSGDTRLSTASRAERRAHAAQRAYTASCGCPLTTAAAACCRALLHVLQQCPGALIKPLHPLQHRALLLPCCCCCCTAAPLPQRCCSDAGGFKQPQPHRRQPRPAGPKSNSEVHCLHRHHPQQKGRGHATASAALSAGGAPRARTREGSGCHLGWGWRGGGLRRVRQRPRGGQLLL